MTTRGSATECSATSGSGRIFYVTDREAVTSDQLYGGERGLTKSRTSVVRYGSIAAPVGRSTLAPCSSRAAFLGALGKGFRGSKHRILIYVHGYYTMFRRSVDDALALERTLRFSVPIVVYSWPSKVTSRLAYVTDENNATWSFSDFRARAAFAGIPPTAASRKLRRARRPDGVCSELGRTKS